MIFLKKITGKILKFDFFELGNSFWIYYSLIFGMLFLAKILDSNSKYVKYILIRGTPMLDAKIIFQILLGIISFWLGYKFLKIKNFPVKFSNVLSRNWNQKKVFPVFFGIFFINFLIKAIRILSGGYFHWARSAQFIAGRFYSLIGILDWLGPMALGMAFANYFYLLKKNDKRYKVWQIISWSAFVLEFFYGFFSFSKFSAIIPIIVYLIVKQYVYEKNFLRVFVAGALIFFVLFPTINFYKNKFSFYSLDIYKNGVFEVRDKKQFIIDSSIGRVNQAEVIFNVFEKTDKFLYGKTLWSFFVSLGPPRLIWQNKPMVNPNGNDFGREYGLLAPEDYTTSVGPTVVGDWYMNFGIIGIIFGMLFFGFLYRFIFDLFIGKSKNSLSGAVIYAIFWLQIIKGTEDWIAPVWAGLVKLSAIFLIIHILLVNFNLEKDD